METFQQPKITGYRQLSAAEADLMNEIKALSVQAGELVAKLRAYPATGANGVPFMAGGNPSLDGRWISIGATDLQTGFMALTRAVAQPSTF